MKPDCWKPVERLYHEALERPLAERAAYLDAACQGDEALRREVDSLLADQLQAEPFIEAPAREIAARAFIEAPHESMAGRWLNSYQMIERIGQGGMGEVYLAQDKRLNRRVAIKLLPEELTEDAARIRRLVQEGNALSSLNHPNITIHEIGAAQGRYFLVTEYIEGETLRQRISDGPLAVTMAIAMAAQVASALAAAHAAGITHRDIKPENIMVRADGLVKVLDFGLVKLFKKPAPRIDTEAATALQVYTEPGLVMGTAPYMSPEQLRGQEIDYRTDIFSLGVVLFETLGGMRPFAGESTVEVMNAILKDEPPRLASLNPKVAPALERIVRRCLEKRMEQRFQSASDLGFALQALSASSGEYARDPAPSRHQAPVSERGRWPERIAWMAAIAALILIALFIGYFKRPGVEPEAIRFSINSLEKTTGISDPAISPDGRYLAFVSTTGDKRMLWLRSMASLAAQPLAGTEGAVQPFWSPDSSRIVWNSNREGLANLYQKAASGAGQDELLFKADNWKWANDWSADGRYIIYAENNPKTKADLWVLALDGNRQAFPFAQTPFKELDARFSRDGKWVAYTSDESGSDEVYVQAFPTVGGKLRISTKGGREAQWQRDGKELFYLAADGMLMSVEVKSGPTFEASAPRALFALRSINDDGGSYEVTGDGQRFLVVTSLVEAHAAPLTVVLNWTAELKR
jgi:eukaryotic-like serine/threonine-protein kinase